MLATQVDDLLTILALTDIRPIVGGRIRTQRKRLDLTIEQVAEDVGLSPQHLGLIERGKAWPQYVNLEAFAACLGVDIEYFFAEVEAKPLKPTPEEALEVLREALLKVKSPVLVSDRPIVRDIVALLPTLDKDRLEEILILAGGTLSDVKQVGDSGEDN